MKNNENKVQAGVTQGLFPLTGLIVGITGNSSFSYCVSNTIKVGCLYLLCKISVTLYPDGAGFKSKGCCGLWWCYSNYWLVGVKWKEEMVVGMMTESKAKNVYPSQQLTQSWEYEQPLLLLAPIADEKCLVWFQLLSMLYICRGNTHMLKQYETWDVSETRNIQIQLVISINPWQNWSC